MQKLKRQIGLFGATIFVLGIIIGAGIYVIIGEAAGITGNTLWISFLLAAIIAGCTGLSYAELSSSFPCDSAEYVYVERAFGDRRFAFGIWWMKLLTHFVAGAAVALGFGKYLGRLTGWGVVSCALLLIAVLLIINLVGLKQAVWFDTFMILIAIAGLVIVIGAGMFFLKPAGFYTESAAGIPGILTAASLVFFAFLGFENVGNMGEEIKDPKRTLPRALILAVAISTALYALVAVVSVSVVPWQELAHSASPIADVMERIIGSTAGIVIAIMALGATGSTVLGIMLGSSRMLYGLAEERVLPKLFLRVTKNSIPYVGLLIFSVICALFVIPGNIKSVAFLTDFGALFMFLVINLCVIVLRYNHTHIERGFTVKPNIGRFPIIPAIGMLSCGFFLFTFSKKLFLTGIVMLLIGMLIFTVLDRRRKKEVGTARMLCAGNHDSTSCIRHVSASVRHAKPAAKTKSGKDKKSGKHI